MCDTCQFTHLHVHSEYSLLDGYAPIKKIVQRAADLGMESIALTDHGVMYGAIDFYDAATKAGVKPIIGVEAYLTRGNHTDHGGSTHHQLLLAKDLEGYRNLVRLTTRAHLDGFWKRPRIDPALLAQHAAGLIATSSCLAGDIPQHLLAGDKKQARERAAYYRDLFGPDNFYLELQLHDNAPELPAVNDELVKIGKELGIPLVVTNDTHFVLPEDLANQHMVMALSFGLTLDEFCNPPAGKRKYTMDPTYHIMTADQMWARFKQYGVDALENTNRIAAMCNVQLEFGRVQLPAFEIPPEHDASSYLRQVCLEGLTRRMKNEVPDHYFARLDYELDVINATGFPDYMLIVWDYVRFARARGIPCLPRGSAGASLILYALGITDVDPVANKLLFERFLSRERLEMPDIDIDFADSRRHEILDYIADKYGRDNTAQIITYGTLGAKAAIRDVGRVLDMDLQEVDKVAKLIPALPVGTTIAQALERVPDLHQLYQQSEQVRDLLDRAQLIEGRMRNVGTHACGVVVSRSPLDEIVPLQHTTKDEHGVMAAYEGPTLAKIGLLKMDILGLANLSIVAKTLEYIEQTTGEHLELQELPLDDRKTFESLSRGETVNVFQLESAGMTRHLRALKPTRVEDIYAMVALYRPGPLEQIPTYIHNKNTPQDISYLHPILEPILQDTYGVIVYQEQIMQLLQAIAGYTLGRAYVVLKAIGKKKRDLMAQEEPRFKEGCLKNGLTAVQADTLWELIQPFAGYSFNRPHSTLYGQLAYQTAYLKNNYPAQYMAAVLDSAAGKIEEVAKAVNECARLRVVVQPVDINASSAGFTFEELPADYIAQEGVQRFGIRFGLSAIKNVGSGPVEAIIVARNEGGNFTSLPDFCARVDRHAVNKRALEALVKCGAFDQLDGTRRQQLAILDRAMAAGSEAQKARESGQSSLFDLFGDTPVGDAVAVADIPLPVVKEHANDKKEELAWEKELLGMYISDHPVVAALRGIDMRGVTSLGALEEGHIGQTLPFVGLLSGVRRATTKKGDSMLIAQLEDADSTIEVVAFPRTLEKYDDLLVENEVRHIRGKVDNRRDSLQLIIQEVAPIQEVVPIQEVEPADALPDVLPDALPDGLPDALLEPDFDVSDISDSPPPARGDVPDIPPPARADDTPDSPPPPIPLPTPVREVAAPAPVPDSPPPARADDTPDSPPPPPAIRQLDGPVQPIRGRSRATITRKSDEPTAPASYDGNGHAGNGHTSYDGNGHTSYDGNGHAPPPPPRDLQLMLPRTNDLDADTRCMQDVHELLTRYEGSDARISLYVPLNEEATALLRPHYTVRLADDLLHDLETLLGVGNVHTVAAIG